jgi:hypothetical protein
MARALAFRPFTNNGTLEAFSMKSFIALVMCQACEEMGKNAEAKKAFVTFLDRWKNADQGLPQLLDARRRLAAL